MQKIRCIAVDDELLALDIIVDYISKLPFLQLIHSGTDALEALQLVQNGQIDLVFLDIQMPQLSGLQFMKIIGNKARVILTTAYPQYALDGYEHNVVDYLLKPVAFDRFYKAVEKAMSAIQPGIVPSPAEKPATPILPDFIFVKTDSKMVKVMLADILYVEGLKDYLALQTTTDKIITLQNMKRMETILPYPAFMRVHKSYIVSLARIDTIERNRLFIHNEVIPIGDTYRDAFFRQIEQRQ
ncbi:LytTR family DNA-binding domain-containing protein [Chitinophaga pendula]|uniref:LytR/AlgR family response regulator transcription factor n=1 Tax=Chitinophaga TaxID=79328 RepID=UPI000BAE8DE6|nr:MULTISPECIES: LytTR family DNA-binding domain-containing protein [Chitinophaga]ASZ11520.1 DNA-binding response regulator [Chitinophaga sp. MD30]UCJ05468.1 LytTR family DNA-binding domain-containing protein [Chitinophaga pendula]